MKTSATASVILLHTLLPSLGSAFTMVPAARTSFSRPVQTLLHESHSRSPQSVQLQAAGEDHASEIERLKYMAAKLRAEAAQLEAQQAEQLANEAKKAFDKFDENQDGEVSVQELKAGLEKMFKTDLPEGRVAKLLDDFDKSGDGALQAEEFVTVDQFRNKLEALARDEKAAAREAARIAKLEEEASKFAQAQLEILNDRPPTVSDKVISVLPYLFPLLDSLQFARFLVMGNPDNPATIAITILYGLYRSIPLSGFVAFLALNFLSGFPNINRLIRFNMQQAIFLDIALFFPGLFAGLFSLLSSGLGIQIPQQVAELGSDAVFFAMMATIAYASVSSLFGQAPDKIPGISQQVLNRIPTIDMFDDQGRFLPENMRDSKKKDEDNDESKKD